MIDDDDNLIGIATALGVVVNTMLALKNYEMVVIWRAAKSWVMKNEKVASLRFEKYDTGNIRRTFKFQMYKKVRISTYIAVVDLRVSSVSSCWQGPLKYCFQGPHPKIRAPPQKKKKEKEKDQRAQWHNRQSGTKDFFAFHFLKPLKFCFGSTEMEICTGKKHFTPGNNATEGPPP